MINKIFFKFFLLLLLTTFVLSGCDTSSKEENKIIVGTAADNPPFEFIQNSKITGFDIELIEKIGTIIGKKIEIHNMEFSGLLAALNSQKIDLSIAGFSITDERRQQVDFSDAYLVTNIAVLYRKEDSDKIFDISSLSGKIIGALLGTTWAQVATQIADDQKATTQLLSNNLLLFEQLKTKAIDVMLVEVSQAIKFQEQNPQLNYFLLDNMKSEFAIALPKNSKFTNQINEAIKQLEKDGFIRELKRKWIKGIAE
jgi:ABC-type amino acid transport substrate-binding protein